MKLQVIGEMDLAKERMIQRCSSGSSGCLNVLLELGRGRLQSRREHLRRCGRRSRLEGLRCLRRFAEVAFLEGRIQEQDANERTQESWRGWPWKDSVKHASTEFVGHGDVFGNLTRRPLSWCAGAVPLRRGNCTSGCEKVSDRFAVIGYDCLQIFHCAPDQTVRRLTDRRSPATRSVVTMRRLVR